MFSRTPTARRFAKTTNTAKKTLHAPGSLPAQNEQRQHQLTPTATTTKEQLRAQLLENQQRFLSYVASIVEERDALKEHNQKLLEKQQRVEPLSRALFDLIHADNDGERAQVDQETKMLLALNNGASTASSIQTSNGASGKQSNNATFKPKKNECISDFIVGDASNGFRCGLCLKQHGDAKCYWNRVSCFKHIHRVHKVQPKMNIPLPKVDYDPAKGFAKKFFEKVGQSDRWKCKVCAGAGREVVVKGGYTSVHLKTMHMRNKKEK